MTLADKQDALSLSGKLNNQNIYTTVYQDKDGWKIVCIFLVGHPDPIKRKQNVANRDDFLKIIEPLTEIDVLQIDGESLQLAKK